MSERVNVELCGGPLDGHRLEVPAEWSVMLAAVGREIHYYVRNWMRLGDLKEFRYQRLLAVCGEGKKAADLLRSHGQPVVELTEEGGAA